MQENPEGFRHFIQCILPPPPDRRIVQVQPSAANDAQEVDINNNGDGNSSGTYNETGSQSTVKVQELHISCENTTIIGDYSSVTFPSYHQKWLVQVQGNATLASMLVLIKEKMLDVDKKYVFFQLGGN